MAAEAGDTLIEVLISAVLIVAVIVATLTGLNNANHATSLDRERSQADALAQQDEDELAVSRSPKLSELQRNARSAPARSDLGWNPLHSSPPPPSYKSDKTGNG